MRKKLGELTTEVHQRNSSLATLSEKSSELERSLRDESDTLDKKVAELKVRGCCVLTFAVVTLCLTKCFIKIIMKLTGKIPRKA